MHLPTTIYPLFENALRAHYGLTMRGASRAARRAVQPLLGRRRAQSVRLVSRRHAAPTRSPRVTPQNRIIGFPYPKYMNAIMEVDQAAAVLMTSVGRRARAGHRRVALGVPLGLRATRTTCGSSPSASTTTARRRSALAGRAGAGNGRRRHRRRSTTSISTAAFRAPVQIGRDMLGIAAGRSAAAHRDRRPAVPRRPGQQLHDARHRHDDGQAARRARHERAGHRPRLVRHQALGRHLQRHATACAPWQREAPATYQAELDAMPHPRFAIEPARPRHDRDLHGAARPRRHTRCAASSSDGSRTAHGSSPTRPTTARCSRTSRPRTRSGARARSRQRTGATCSCPPERERRRRVPAVFLSFRPPL